MYYSYAYYTSAIIAILCPVAVVGNVLVLAAVYRNSSLRTPFYILLACLAFTDLSTGIITQPLYVSVDFLYLTKRQLNMILDGVAYGCTTFFSSMTVLILTVMSVERWLQMTHRSLVTARKTYFSVVVLLLIAGPVTGYNVVFATRGTQALQLNILIVSVLSICLMTTSVFYFKVFRLVKRHQQRIRANEYNQHFGQVAIDFAKYKKSFFTILCMVAVFYLSYVPICIATLLDQLLNNPEFVNPFFDIAMLFVFLSSSLNPLLYVWRMRDVRSAVEQLVKQIFRQ